MMDKDELRKWCRANWNKIPLAARKEMLDHLDKWILDPNNPERDKNLVYLRNYDNEPFFHFSSGMAIRNKLRELYTDDVISYLIDGESAEISNWDDYYTGAIDELLERYP